MELTLNYITITGVLIVLGLLLSKWQPPIKRQYIAIILLLAGSLLGYFIIQNILYGFMLAGLVFYKDDLVKESKDVVESFKEIKKLDCDDENTNK